MSGDEPVTRLVLIRHGEAQCAVDQVVGGHEGCTGLSELGRRQSKALATRLQESGELDGADVLYASVLPRAVETAEHIADAVGATEIRRECELCEVHPGEADGLTWEEYRQRFASEDRPGPLTYVSWAPGAESWAEFAVRAGRALNRLVHEHRGETVVAACHGGIIEASLLTFGQMPVERHWRVQIDNTSITEWQLRTYDDWHRGERWTLVRFNDAAHLEAL